MTEIPYSQFQEYLQGVDSGALPPAYLFFGEEYLYKSALSALIDQICPEIERASTYEVLDGSSVGVFSVIESVNTYPFLSDRKIVVFADAKIFYSGQDKEKLLENAKAAYLQEDVTKAAKSVLRFLGLMNLSLEEATLENIREALKDDSGNDDLEAWLEETIAFARNEKLSIPASQDEAGSLEKAIEKGFPKGNLLIITTDLVDKRRRLYQTIKTTGIIVDCSMPKGSRQADRQAQEALLQETAKRRLSGSGKRIDKAAYAALMDLTGADPRLFAGNIDTLVSYVGERPLITAADVQAVLSRTKQDPIFELTGAVGDRQLSKALLYLDSLLSNAFHPLQILSALAKQIRKLIAVKDFTGSEFGRAWRGDMPFPQFKGVVLPSMVLFDEELSKRVGVWDEMLSPSGKTASKRSKKKTDSDVGIGVKSNNPYPAFLLLRKSENFTMLELINGLKALQEADLQMKTSGQSPRVILENALFRMIGNPQKRSAA